MVYQKQISGRGPKKKSKMGKKKKMKKSNM